MELSLKNSFSKTRAGVYLFDILALAVIYLLPTFSHLISFPLYLIEPMRIAIIFSVIFTNRTNAFIIAFTLPAFSWVVSSHPEGFKMFLMTTELALNVYLFYILRNKFGDSAIWIAVSILLAKGYYYLGKFVLVQFSLISGDFVATPLLIQLGVLIGLTIIYFAVTAIMKKKKA